MAMDAPLQIRMNAESGSTSPAMMWCGTVWMRRRGRSIPGVRIGRRTWRSRIQAICANRAGFKAGMCQNLETGPIAIFFDCAVEVYPNGIRFILRWFR